jgi:bifunctional UDP-N-acetylglucosamine pyrophosphorylase/glucosamine-1-phosphate N-acetyltransferase
LRHDIARRIGNFVETKDTIFEVGVKVDHLSYVGDAHVGANAIIGAFVGSNSSLMAPVKIGSGAYVGSGSVITKDVPDDALAVERSQQNTREGGAKRYREMKMRGGKPKGS